METQLTTSPHGHILTNVNVWSPDGDWIVYDIRSDEAGSVFDGTRIEKVNLRTREVRTLYESRNGACCGVATYSPTENKVAFILGPENPTPDWPYAPAHRQGMIVDESRPGIAINLDARDLVPPFTPGALRGGSHVHIFSGDGRWVSFTYNDHILGQFDHETPHNDIDLRNVGVAVPARPIVVPKTHPRNHDGTMFSVLVTGTTAQPRPGSDEISKAFEDAWVGVNGYIKPDGSRQRRAIAFQGQVLTVAGQCISEVFLADLPEDLTIPGDGPLQGTQTRRPAPPNGVTQRRLTCTADRRHPGLQGPRHWLRSSPDGSRIAFLMKDDAGIVQLWTISPNGGPPSQLTHSPHPIASAFTWHPTGQSIACIIDTSVCLIDAATGQSRRLTPPCAPADTPRPEACVFSPDGRRIAYVRRIACGGERFNQVFAVSA